MNAVLISIRPEWCEKIASGEKTIEVRKNRPKIETPFKCYIYMTAGNASYPVTKNGAPYVCHNNGGKVVIGEFVCDKIFDICIEISKPDDLSGYPFPCTGLTDKEVLQYLGNGNAGYGWHISDLKIYDEPKGLDQFWVESNQTYDYPQLVKLKRPPQSWCYVEVGE